jgi:hypothetical protein
MRLFGLEYLGDSRLLRDARDLIGTGIATGYGLGSEVQSGRLKEYFHFLERGPLSLVSTTEELLDRKVAAPV